MTDGWLVEMRAEALYEMSGDLRWSEADEETKQMYRDHAESLAMYEGGA